MKVCTDSLLFGAMAPVEPTSRLLDIGTGTGILALMAAQLGAASVVAVELTPEAAQEAQGNFLASPWAAKLHIKQQRIQDFSCAGQPRFDLIICNPPFFADHQKPADALRNIARHTDQLSHRELLTCIDQLLAENGRCYLLIPTGAIGGIIALAATAGFYLLAHTDYCAYAGKPAKVAALLFGRQPTATPLNQKLIIYAAPGVYTGQSTAYLKSFLMRFADGRPEQPSGAKAGLF